MSLFRRFGASLSGAVLALVLPLSQSQAADCVRLNALNHCGIGAARLSLTGTSVLVENGSETGMDGVAIHTGPMTSWSAAAFIETNAPESKTVLSSVSGGAVTSSAFIEQRGESIAYGASFTGSGSRTYSVSVYREGVLKAYYIYPDINPSLLPVTRPSLSFKWSPSCRPIGQSYSQCMVACRRYGSCNYCKYPCGSSWASPYGGVSSWSFALAYSSVTLPDGRVVEGDELVLTEERDNPGSSAPVCDELRIQTTAQSTTLFSSSIVRAK